MDETVNKITSKKEEIEIRNYLKEIDVTMMDALKMMCDANTVFGMLLAKDDKNFDFIKETAEMMDWTKERTFLFYKFVFSLSKIVYKEKD